MKEKFSKELESLIQSNSQSDYRENKEQISLLLKEFARRLLLCGELINQENIDLNLSSNIIFDAARVVMGAEFILDDRITDLVGQDSDRFLSFFDKYVFASYFNWKNNKKEMTKLGRGLLNPYRPYVEIFKLGGFGLKYESPTLEVYPFIRIVVHPRSEYMQDLPFWKKDLIGTDSEEE